MKATGWRQATILLVLAASLVAAPGEARPVPTGGLGSRWLLSPVEVSTLPAGWEEALHALAALGSLQQPPTLAPDVRWREPTGRRAPPWARLRASGFRIVPAGVATRRDLAAWVALGIDGAEGDRPDVLAALLAATDADADGRPGECLAPDGALDAARFELRGYAGARGLRPENTLPAFEAALEAGVGAIHVPIRLSRDGLAVPSLDASVRPGKHRSLGRAASVARGWGLALEGPAIASLPLEELRNRYDRGVALAGQPAQVLDPEASPVSAAFVRQRGWPALHAYVSLGEAFAFARALAEHHETGPGRLLPEAAARARIAREVRWVVGLPGGAEGVAAGRAALAAGRAAGGLGRLTLQAAEVETLAALHREAPTVALSLALP